MIATGKINRKVTISTPGALSDDGLGGFTEASATTRDVWASVNKLSMKDILNYNLETSVIAYQFIFQYHTGKNLTINDSLIFNGETYGILSVIDPGEAHEQINVIASGRTN